MSVKLIVISLLIITIASLFSGLFFMMKDKGRSTRTVKALTLRIGLSVAALLLLIIGAATGLISPHGLGG